MTEKERTRQRPDNQGDDGQIDDGDQNDSGSGKNAADAKKKLDKALEELKKTRKRAEEAAATVEKDDSQVKQHEQDVGQ